MNKNKQMIKKKANEAMKKKKRYVLVYKIDTVVQKVITVLPVLVFIIDSGKFADFDSVTAKNLAGVPMITIMDESIHSELASWSGKYAVKMNPIAHYNLISNAAALVKGTENVAVCAEPACKFEGVKFIPFSPVLTMGNFVAWKRTSSQSKLETAFLQYIRSKLGLSEE